jgi:rod shape-determining protein MreC
MSSPQFRYQKLIFPAILWLFSLITLSVQSFQKGQGKPSPFSRETADAISFPQRAYAYSTQAALSFWKNYLDLLGTRKENLELQKQVAYFEMENQMLREQARETERLRAMLDFAGGLALQTFPARIIGWDLSSYGQTMTINKGRSDGLSAGMAVICPQGLVGQLVDEPGRPLSRHRGQVLLITDPTSRVSVTVERTRDRGILQGTGQGEKMLLIYLHPDARLEAGDELVTSGLGGVFPPGIKVGKITAMEVNPFFGSPQGLIKPAVDFNHLEQVLVVVGREGSGFSEAPIKSEVAGDGKRQNP